MGSFAQRPLDNISHLTMLKVQVSEASQCPVIERSESVVSNMWSAKLREDGILRPDPVQYVYQVFTTTDLLN